MLKKSIKNILLIILVLTGFILVYQIWFSSYFLPDGYNYFASGLRSKVINPIIRLLEGRKGTDFSQNLHTLFKPEKIVLHASGDRRVFSSGSEEFNQIRVLSADIISNCLLGEYALKSRETVDLESYFSVLKGKSIYVDYGKNCDYRLFSYGVCGQEKNRFTDDLSAIRGYIISLHDGILNDISLYIMDQKSGNIYRYTFEADKNQLEKRLEAFMAAPSVSGSPSYSFELNFHKEQAQSVSKVLFDPLILMDLVPVNLPPVHAYSANEVDQMLSEGLTEAVLGVFSINNRTMRKYTDLDNARVFVENNATLTLYPDGLLEYQVVQGGRGLDITGGADKTGYDIYAATAHAVDFVTELCSHMPPAFFDHLQINTNLVDDAARQGVYRLYFDYCIGGVPIRYKTADGYAHTIEMEIDNGYLKSYRQFMKAYEKADGEAWQMMPMLSAADALVDSLYTGESPLLIKKISPCYTEDADGTIVPKWNAVVDGNDRMID